MKGSFSTVWVGLRFSGPSFGLWIPIFRLRLTGLGFPDFWFQPLDFECEYTIRAPLSPTTFFLMLWLQLSGFRFRTSGSRFRVPDFSFQASGFWFRVPGFGFRVSGFGFRVSYFGLWVSGFGFRVSGFELRVSGFRVPLL